MFSGIASYLFGGAGDDEANCEVSLTTFPMDNEWELVEREEQIPLPVEHCPLICHLEESTVQSVEQGVPAAGDVIADRRRSNSSRAVPRRPTVARSALAAPTPCPHHRQSAKLPPHAMMSRNALQRANRVHERLSHCQRPRRYNYKLCVSDRQRKLY